MYSENEISKLVVDLCYKIHTQYGPGLFESVYEEIFCYEWEKNGILFSRQQPVPLVHEAVKLDIGFRADLIVEEEVIVELKSVESLAPVHSKILLTYLKLTGKKLGLLINFNENLLKDGIKRIVNNY